MDSAKVNDGIRLAESAKAMEKTKPVFVKVESLRPATKGHNLVVKVHPAAHGVTHEVGQVLDSKPVGGGGIGRGGASLRMSECLVGDETGVIIFTARNEQGTHRGMNSFKV